MQESLFFIHIMKTGGTSLRNMIVNNLGENIIYPTSTEIQQFPKKHYPSTHQLLENIDKIRNHKILIGHYPYSLLKQLNKKKNYQAVTFLREPVSRTISMLNHRKRVSPEFANTSFEEFLKNESLVKNQILNYQTKILSMNLGEVNKPFPLNEKHIEIAISNLQRCRFVGINEYFNTSCILFDKIFDTSLSTQIRHDNTTKTKNLISSSSLRKIEKLVELDLILYKEAVELFKERTVQYGINIVNS